MGKDIPAEWQSGQKRTHHEYPAIRAAYPYVDVFLSVPPCRDHPCTCGSKIMAAMRRRKLSPNMIQGPPNKGLASLHLPKDETQ